VPFPAPPSPPVAAPSSCFRGIAGDRPVPVPTTGFAAAAAAAVAAAAAAAAAAARDDAAADDEGAADDNGECGRSHKRHRLRRPTRHRSRRRRRDCGPAVDHPRLEHDRTVCLQRNLSSPERTREKNTHDVRKLRGRGGGGRGNRRPY